MKPPPIPPDEPARLAALEETHLFHSPAEERFDRITRLAAKLFDAPIALVSLVGETRQWFKSAQGLEAQESPREVAFCAHAIADGDHLVVEDATADERFAANPLVTGGPCIRAYAGKVIRSSSGQPLGTLCVIDREPRHFSEEQLSLLGDLSAIAEGELRRAAPGAQAAYLREAGPGTREGALDAATRCWTNDAMVEILMRQARQADAAGESFALGLVRIERLRQVCERAGDESRDQALRDAATAIKRVLGESDALGRYDEETFVVMLAGADSRTIGATAERMRHSITSRSFRAQRLSVWLDATLALALRRPGTALASRLEDATRALGQALQDGSGIAVLADDSRRAIPGTA